MGYERCICVLLLEDNREDIHFVEHAVACEPIKLYQAEKVLDALTILDYRHVDVILCDLSIAGAHGLETFEGLHKEYPGIPIIVLSDQVDEHISIQAVREGAQDFMWKSQITKDRLVRSIYYAIERASMLEEVRDSEKKKNEFLAQFSHEIRTPLNAVTGMASLLIDKVDDNEQKRMVGAIQKGADRLLHIINNILEISKIDAGQMKVIEEEFHVREFVSNILKSFSEKTDKNIIFVDMISHHIPESVLADKSKIHKVLCHLLDNATNFTDDGSIVVEASIQNNHQLYFAVRDSGCGISVGNQKKLFHPFSQIKHGTEASSGTGLGLVSCKKIVEFLGGECGVTSQRGKGSSFWFTVNHRPVIQKFHRHLQGKKIIITADHDDKIASYCVKQLESEGAQVALCHQQKLDAYYDVDFILGVGQSPEIQKNQSCETLKVKHEDIVNNGFLSQTFLCQRIAYSLNITRDDQNDIESDREIMVRRVLVVDDEMINRKIMVKILTSLQIEAITANDGEEALAAYEKHDADVIFMDCFMPNMDGYEATKALRKLGCDSQIIALTAHALDENKKKCISFGMNDFLTKPVGLEDIREVLRKIR